MKWDLGLNLSARQIHWKLGWQVNINRRKSAYMLEAWGVLTMNYRGIFTLKICILQSCLNEKNQDFLCSSGIYIPSTKLSKKALWMFYIKKIQTSLWKPMNTIMTKKLTWYSCGLRPVLLAETHSRAAWTQSIEKMPGISKQPYWQQPLGPIF